MPAAALEWRRLDAPLRRLVIGMALLAFAAIPEVLVVLAVSGTGLAVAMIPLVWAGASLLKMFVAWPAGLASDRLGRTAVLAVGWTARVVVMALFAALPPASGTFAALFVVYAMTLASTEAAERSLIADRAPSVLRGTAFGIYHLATGIAVLPGAAIFGWLWQRYGITVAWSAAAVSSGIAATYVIIAAARLRPLRS
jgi:MFS family permease